MISFVRPQRTGLLTRCAIQKSLSKSIKPEVRYIQNRIKVNKLCVVQWGRHNMPPPPASGDSEQPPTAFSFQVTAHVSDHPCIPASQLVGVLRHFQHKMLLSCHRSSKCIAQGRGRTQISRNKTTKEYNEPTQSVERRTDGQRPSIHQAPSLWRHKNQYCRHCTLKILHNQH